MKIARNMMIVALVCSGMVSYGATAVVTPDGTKQYAILDGDDNITVTDLTTDTVVATIAMQLLIEEPIDIRMRPDGTELYVLNENFIDHSLRVTIIDTDTDTILGTVDDVYDYFAPKRTIAR
jgi:DNA-binding beta-propeller fold protein YncE